MTKTQCRRVARVACCRAWPSAGPWQQPPVAQRVFPRPAQVGQFEAEMSSDSFQLLGMAERGFLPKVLARRSRFGTPTLGIVLSSLGICSLVTFNFLQARARADRAAPARVLARSCGVLRARAPAACMWWERLACAAVSAALRCACLAACARSELQVLAGRGRQCALRERTKTVCAARHARGADARAPRRLWSSSTLSTAWRSSWSAPPAVSAFTYSTVTLIVLPNPCYHISQTDGLGQGTSTLGGRSWLQSMVGMGASEWYAGAACRPDARPRAQVCGLRVAAHQRAAPGAAVPRGPALVGLRAHAGARLTAAARTHRNARPAHGPAGAR
jgi:hypothetical protein